MAIRFLADTSTDKQILVVGTENAGTADYGFVGDENTGMYRPSNHSVALTANGTAKLTASTAQVNINPTLNLSTVVNAGTDTDKFLVLDTAGNVDFRTGAQVRSDIGAGTSSTTGTVTSIGTTSPIEGGTITTSGTISHAAFTDTESTDSSSLSSGGTFIAYTDVTTNATGHVTGHNLRTYTLPTSTANTGTVTSVTLAAGTGISLSGTNPITTNGTITITNTSPNVSETFTEWVVRDDDNDDKTLSGSSNKYLKFTAATGTAGTNLTGTGTSADPYVMAITLPNDNSGGTVTSVATDNGLKGGTITGSGTIEVKYDSGADNIMYSGFDFTGDTVVGTDIIMITNPGSTTTTRRIGYVNVSDLPFTNNSGTVTGTGTANKVAKFSSSSAIANSTITDDGSNVSMTGDLTVSGGDFKLGSSSHLVMKKVSGTLTMGDANFDDETTTVQIAAFGSTQLTLQDDTTTIASGTINYNGTLQNGGSGREKYTVNASGGSSYQGEIISLYSNSTTAGKVYMHSDFASAWSLADADDQSTKNLLAIATASNSSSGMLLRGIVRYSSGHGLVSGRPIYVSNTAGEMTNTAPTGSGDYVRVIGYAINSAYIYFNPDTTWVELT